MQKATETPPMTDLQQQVLSAIQSAKTDEEKAVAAIHQVAMWWWVDGYLGTANAIHSQNPPLTTRTVAD